jgi:hypothetical protein
MLRNPAAKNAGKLMTLPEFLDLAKASNITGILIEIEVTNNHSVRLSVQKERKKKID